MRGVVAVILAGGKGTRLEPLTRDRTKPAVPFGGAYRIIDFTLSNCLNSGLRQMLVLTQYKAASLDRHINRGWQFLCPEFGEFITTLPPEQRIGEHWYQGTADAVYQNIYTIERERPEHVLILSGDHIYRMDYSRMLREHLESNADATIACIPVAREEASQFGVMEADETGRVVQFAEKPENPQTMVDDPTQCLASMGIYVFKAGFLFNELDRDATEAGSSRDFGKNIIPSIIDSKLVRAFRFADENGKAEYWRDVGTLDAYYEAHMDLISVHPQLNLYNANWPIRTYHAPNPPAKFVFDEAGDPPRVGHAVDSIVCPGTIVSGGSVRRSILSPRVRVSSYASVEDSILLEGVTVGRHARIRRAIIDKHAVIPDGAEIGFDSEKDRAAGWMVTESGLVTLPKSINMSR
ncbi:MAG: glucose-1-phosphate adenylyltransferase [Planctomycetaceae bacterium]